MNILLLEDDTVLADILFDYLSQDYKVTHTYSMKEALSFCDKNSYDLYIFDINVADGDGITLLRELRSFLDETPTIFITAFHDIKYLKSAFESGANDFIKKPFELEELSLRIDNIKRHFGLDETVELCESIILDTKIHMLKSSGLEIQLSQKESAVLLYLYQHRHRVVSSQEMLQNFWDYDEMPSSDTIRTLIKNLRKYLGKEHILNVRGEGYRFE